MAAIFQLGSFVFRGLCTMFEVSYLLVLGLVKGPELHLLNRGYLFYVLAAMLISQLLLIQQYLYGHNHKLNILDANSHLDLFKFIFQFMIV